MSDKELVKALRAVDHMSLEDCFCQSSLYDEAANYIEQLTAENERMREALTVISQFLAATSGNVNIHAMMTEHARAALNRETP